MICFHMIIFSYLINVGFDSGTEGHEDFSLKDAFKMPVCLTLWLQCLFV